MKFKVGDVVTYISPGMGYGTGVVVDFGEPLSDSLVYVNFYGECSLVLVEQLKLSWMTELEKALLE